VINAQAFSTESVEGQQSGLTGWRQKAEAGQGAVARPNL